MKTNTPFDEDFENEPYFNKRDTKTSRSKEKNQARRKIDAYLERKSLKKLLDDYGDIDNYFDDDIDLDDYIDEFERIDYNLNSDFRL